MVAKRSLMAAKATPVVASVTRVIAAHLPRAHADGKDLEARSHTSDTPAPAIRPWLGTMDDEAASRDNG